MIPREFLAYIQKHEPRPAYLFLGPEHYERNRCSQALIARVLAPEERESGVVRHSLDEVSLSEVVDDARSLSLFAPKRVIVVSNAEAALPRGRAATAEEDAPGKGEEGGEAQLARYLEDPTPGAVLVFEASRYGFDGEDKTKVERVRNFFSVVPDVVEFRPFSENEAMALARDLARQAGLKIGGQELDLLVEATGAEAARIAMEIEKLALAVDTGQTVTADLISQMVPDARTRSIFALVGAIGRGDRQASLDILDTLVRQGEYLPLALAFLSTQLRFALVAQEAGLREAGQILGYFARLGIPMWRSRAEQVAETARIFSRGQILTAMKETFAADRALRSTRPDDRLIVEDFILRITKAKAARR